MKSVLRYVTLITVAVLLWFIGNVMMFSKSANGDELINVFEACSLAVPPTTISACSLDVDRICTGKCIHIRDYSRTCTLSMGLCTPVLATPMRYDVTSAICTQYLGACECDIVIGGPNNGNISWGTPITTYPISHTCTGTQSKDPPDKDCPVCE